MTGDIRRRKGSGYLYQTNHGWMVRHSETRNGKQFRWSDGPFPTQESALRAAEASSPLNAGNAIRLNDYLADWLAVQKTMLDSIGDRTRYEQYRKHINKLHAVIPDSLLLGRTHYSDVRKMWFALLADGLSSKYIRNIRSTLKQALDTALHDDRITSNPAQSNPIPRSDATPEKAILEEQEWIRLIDYLIENRSTPYALGCLIAAMAGMRAGEVCGLTWQHVDFERDEIRVEQQVVRRRMPNVVELVPSTKTRTNRNVAMAPVLKAALLSEAPPAHGRTLNDFIVRDTQGAMATPQGILKWIQTYGYPGAGVQDIGMHGLRHTFASHLLLAGVNDEKVSRQLGHSNTMTTKTVYSHLSNARRQEIADDIHRVINEQRERMHQQDESD